MTKNFKFQISNSRGITLIEIVVVIFVIAIFSVILVSDFPKIQRQFALSRIAYKLGQDIRKTEDLGLSGVSIKDAMGNSILAKGYGIFINLGQSTKQYGIYADRGDVPNYEYDGNPQSCSSITDNNFDCVVETSDISEENISLYIKGFKNVTSSYTSINFSPPNPTVKIKNICNQTEICEYTDKIGIVLGLIEDSSAERTVWINTSGLIEVK